MICTHRLNPGFRISRFFVALACIPDLLKCAKHLLVAAILAGPTASHTISQGTGHHRAAGPRQARTMLGCQDDDDLHHHPRAAARGHRRRRPAAAGGEDRGLSERLCEQRELLHSDVRPSTESHPEGRHLPRQLVHLGLILRRAAATALITPTERSRFHGERRARRTTQAGPRCNLSRADLSGVDLSWTHVGGADLSGALLYGALLAMANLGGADSPGRTSGVPSCWRPTLRALTSPAVKSIACPLGV
jgi:Pentapeptide repeats (8 copies)